VLGAVIDSYVTPFMYPMLSSNFYEKNPCGDVCVSWSNFVVACGL
jgi:hypothetical protein